MKVWYIARQGWCLLGNALCSTIETLAGLQMLAAWLESDTGEESSDVSESSQDCSMKVTYEEVPVIHSAKNAIVTVIKKNFQLEKHV